VDGKHGPWTTTTMRLVSVTAALLTFAVGLLGNGAVLETELSCTLSIPLDCIKSPNLSAGFSGLDWSVTAPYWW